MATGDTTYITKNAWHFQYICKEGQPFYTALVTNQGASAQATPWTEEDDITQIKTVFPQGAIPSTSLLLDATTEKVVFGTDSSLDPAAGDFSLSFWIKTEDSTGIIYRRYTNSTSAGFYIQIVTNKIRFMFQKGAGVNVNTDSATSINDNVWHHIACTAARGGNMQIYIDGSPDGTPAEIDTTDITLTETAQVSTGSGIGTLNYAGNIDDLRYYNKALSQAEVTNLYNNVNVTSGLVSHWKFEEGTGTVATDSVGSNDGTITEATWSLDGRQLIYGPLY